MNVTEKWLFCPKCKQEVLVNVREFVTARITELDALDAI